MKKTINAMRLTITQILKAGLGLCAIAGVPPTLQASTKVDPLQIQRIDDIRLRLREIDSLAKENPHDASDTQADEHVASWYDFLDWPNWSTWNNWGNGWRNF